MPFTCKNTCRFLPNYESGYRHYTVENKSWCPKCDYKIPTIQVNRYCPCCGSTYRRTSAMNIKKKNKLKIKREQKKIKLAIVALYPKRT